MSVKESRQRRHLEQTKEAIQPLSDEEIIDLSVVTLEDIKDETKDYLQESISDMPTPGMKRGRLRDGRKK